MNDVAMPPPHPPDPADAKDLLRATIRAARRARSARRRERAAGELADVVDAIPHIAASRCIAAYASRGDEPGTGVILERLASRGVRVLLPVLGAGLSRCWAEYRGPEDLQVRAPGRPPEPGSAALDASALTAADAVLVPALAVDTAGARLGQGGGWYDRALEHARRDAAIIALLYPEEVYPASDNVIPTEPHDRQVGAVATPQGWRTLG